MPGPGTLIPLAGIILIIAIVGMAFWHKVRETELQVHQDMRIREMEHQRKMKELELEKVKARPSLERVA